MATSASTRHTTIRRALAVATMVFALCLAGALSAAAAPSLTAVDIGANTEHLSGQAAVAVDPAGTAYVAWQTASGAALNFCKLPLGASACSSTLQLALPSGSTFAVVNPSVLVEGTTVHVFAEAIATNEDDEGMVGFASTDGGATFSPLLGGAAISAGPPDSQATLDPVFALPGGKIGVGYVVAPENPAFQVVSLSSPSEDSVARHPTPIASLNPSPNDYTIANLGGQIAPQLSGSEGLLGAFELIEAGPCPTSDGIDYAFAPLPASDAELNASTGAGSAWQPEQLLECNADYPAVAGGPAGLGVIDEDETNDTIVYHPFAAATRTFAAPVTIAAGHELEPALSQDGAGGVYATWVSNLDALDLDYSSRGGASWPKPVALVNAGEHDVAGATSAVNSAGQGWAAYTVANVEYARPFDAATVSAGGATETIDQSASLEGEHATLSAPSECVRNGIVKGTLTVKIASHKHKGHVVVKIYEVIFSLGSVHETITRKHLSNAPFLATLHVPGLTPGKRYVLSARAFIAVHHGPPRSKTLHVTLTACA